MKTRIRTCNGCKAAQENQYSVTCRLGFHVQQLEHNGKTIVANGGIRPVGDDGICPKPKNYSDLIYWSKIYPRKTGTPSNIACTPTLGILRFLRAVYKPQPIPHLKQLPSAPSAGNANRSINI